MLANQVNNCESKVSEPPAIHKAEERRRNILDMLKRRQFVSTSELSETLMTSEVSIRKDFEFLQGKGLLKRVHGGAKAIDEAYALLDLSERYLVNRTAKESIALRAAQFLAEPDLCIYVDTGTTCMLLARAIPRGLSVTIVTNSLTTIMALEGRTSCDVITLGGKVDYRHKIFQGPWADEQLSRFAFDYLFVGADGLSEDGYYCDDLVQAELLRKAIARAQKSYVLADSSKASVHGSNMYASLSEVTALVTDPKLPESLAAHIEKNDGSVILCG